MSQKGDRLPTPKPTNRWLAERIELFKKLTALAKANR